MREGLIGHTGFVGSNLKALHDFTDYYNSKNSEDLVGANFDRLICAGVSAMKWLANKEPEADWAAIERLMRVLEQVTVTEMILISSIDIYPDPSQPLDESAVIDPETNHAYGRHRLRLENWICERFPLVRVVRLPAIYGPGMKKNALYDLMHDNLVEKINPASRFQWYPLTRLWSDLEIVCARDLRLVNLFGEPLPISRLVEGYFPTAQLAAETHPAPTYRVKTRYAEEFGGSGGYIFSTDACYAEIGAFIDQARGTAA
ncbi:MAG: hypothetical protein Kilf2KO_05050 [Rhodospirillales bacterium]